MLRVTRHFLFTIAMIGWAGLCLYLMEKAQQLPVGVSLSHLLSLFEVLTNNIPKQLGRRIRNYPDPV